MAAVTIETVKNKKDLDIFLKFQWKIYKDNPYWVPPLLYDKKKLLDKKKNPFFKHAEMEMFLAYKNGDLCGRIAAIKNDLHNKENNDNVGFFGFFESYDDQEIANALLNAAQNWLKEKGFDHMRGPANPSVNDEYGMLVDGFNDQPRLLMPYNPEYYINLFENFGLVKARDLYAWHVSYNRMKQMDKIGRVAEIAKKRNNMIIRTLNMKDFKAELDRVKFVYNKAWEPNWGFVPLTDEEMDTLAADFKPLVDPEIVLFAEVEGKTVGFALVMPDYNFLFKDMNGKLFPFNFIKLLTRRKSIKWVRIIILGVIPEFQKRGMDAALYYEIMMRCSAKGIYDAEASWVLEDNDMMNRGAEAMNAEHYKTYRVYEKEI